MTHGATTHTEPDHPPPGLADAPDDDWTPAPRNGTTPLRRVRVEPHDWNAERAVLSACLTFDQADCVTETLAAGLEAEHFHKPDHTHIWRAIVAVHASGHTPDATLVADQLAHDRAPIDGATLVGLMVDTPTVYRSNIAKYAAIVVDTHRSRAALTSIAAAIDALYDGTEPAAVLDRIVAADAWTPAAVGDDAYFVDPHADVADNPMPTVGERSDGTVALFYRGQLNSLIGESESCKSWIAQWACVEQIQLCEHVFYLDYEKDYAEVRNRLYAMGATVDEVTEYFHYERVEDPFTAAKLARFRAQCDRFVPALCVIDGVNTALMLEGLKPNDPDHIAKFYGGAPRVAQKVNAAVVLIDHLKKDRDASEPGAGGSQHKRAGITGASYKMRLTKKMSPAQSGRGFLKVDKDALGQARAACPDAESFGDVVLTVDDGKVTVEVAPPALAPVTKTADGVKRRTGYMERVSTIVENAGVAGVSIEGARRELECKREYAADALACLAAEGYVTREGNANKAKYFHVRRFVDESPRSYYEKED